MKNEMDQALVYVHEKEYNKALDCYRQIEIEGLHGQAGCMIRLGRYADALRLLDRGLETDRDNERCLQLKSILLENMRNQNISEQDLSQETYFESLPQDDHAGRHTGAAQPAGRQRVPVNGKAHAPQASRPAPAGAAPQARVAAKQQPRAAAAVLPAQSAQPTRNAHAAGHTAGHAGHANQPGHAQPAPQPGVDPGYTYLELNDQPKRQPAPAVRREYESPWGYALNAALVAIVVLGVNSFVCLSMNLIKIRYRELDGVTLGLFHDLLLLGFIFGGVHFLLMKTGGFATALSPLSAGMLAGLAASVCGIFQFGIANEIAPTIAASMLMRTGNAMVLGILVLTSAVIVPALTGFFTYSRVRQNA